VNGTPEPAAWREYTDVRRSIAIRHGNCGDRLRIRTGTGVVELIVHCVMSGVVRVKAGLSCIVVTGDGNRPRVPVGVP
jgi:hypothetical protein